jgi:hypothetical protein
MRAASDPKKDARKVTNTDEQEVVVNHSTEQEGGYDEPVNQQVENDNPAPVEKEPEVKKTSGERKAVDTPALNEERRRKYPDEESE